MIPTNHVQNLANMEMATSNSFEADLPELTPEQLTKLYAWGHSSCDHWDLRMNPDMSMVLLATRKKQDNVRGHMRLLRTNLINWGVALPTKQKGWLRLVNGEGNSDGAAQEAADAPSNPIQNVPHTSHRSFLTLPPNLLTIPIASH